jgi:predicted Zn-dependent protease with MMP-like domain
MASFLRRGSAADSAVVCILLGLPAALIVLAHDWVSSAWATAGLVVLWLGVAYGLGWLLTAKLSRDLDEVRAQRQQLEEYTPAADRAFSGASVRFTVSDDELVEIAEDELQALPVWIKRAIREYNVSIGIEDERPGEPRVLGLFQSQTMRITGMSTAMSTITLYKTPILRVSRDRAHLRQVVHGTLLHEIGHMFGMSEDDLDHFSIGNEPRADAVPVHPPPEPPRD